MFKSLIAKKKILNFLNRRLFSTAKENFLFPDQVVHKLSNCVREEKELAEVEAEIFERINFFDADQFLDTVSLLAQANKGTEALWDMLSRKVFDYEFDIAQTFMLGEVLKNCNKHEAFMTDRLARDNLVWDLKWPKAGRTFVEKLL